MPDLLKSISLAALLACAGPAFAQNADTPPPEADAADQDAAEDAAPEEQAEQPSVVEPSGTDGLNMGEPADGPASAPASGPGSSYSAGEFGDWEQRCVRAEEGADPCQLYQLLEDGNGNAVAEMSIFPLPQGREAAAGSTIITPLETLLTRAVTISVDGGQARRYPFDFCAPQGCFARVGFTQAEIDQFKRGSAGRMVIVPAAAPDQQIQLTISLSGFTAGYDAVVEANTVEE